MVPEPRHDAEPNGRGGSMTAVKVGACGRRRAPRLVECSEGSADGEAGAGAGAGEERSSMLLVSKTVDICTHVMRLKDVCMLGTVEPWWTVQSHCEARLSEQTWHRYDKKLRTLLWSRRCMVVGFGGGVGVHDFPAAMVTVPR